MYVRIYRSQKKMATMMRGLRPLTRTAQRSPAAVRQGGRRGMGGAPVDPATLPWPDNKIRAVIKHDWQLVIGIVGFYTGLVLLGKAAMGGGKKEEAVMMAAAPATGAFPPSGYKSGVEPGGSGVPSMVDPEFEAWAAVPGNMALWEASVAKM